MASAIPALWMNGLSAGQRFGACFLLSACVAVPYVRSLISRARPGISRILLCLPLCAACLAMPAAFDCRGEILGRMVTMFVFSWLANFKVGMSYRRTRDKAPSHRYPSSDPHAYN